MRVLKIKAQIIYIRMIMKMANQWRKITETSRRPVWTKVYLMENQMSCLEVTTSSYI